MMSSTNIIYKSIRIFCSIWMMLMMFFFNSNLHAEDLEMKMQVWYYVWNWTNHSISWLGFKPSLVVIKAHTTAWATVFKTSAMPNPNTAYYSATADNINSQIVLENDWFMVKTLAAVNSPNIHYTWTAFWNSNCVSGGNFCVGYYIGDGTAAQKITNNFQWDIVRVKRSSTLANWCSSVMPNNYGQFFDATSQNTAGALFTTMDSDGFTVGLTNNTNLWIYYYVVFKNTPGIVNAGMYTGNGLDNRNISDIWFRPNWTYIKNANIAAAGVHKSSHNYWDYSNFFSSTASATNTIQELQVNGVQVWSNNAVNGSWNSIYRSAFWWISAPTSNGAFILKNWSYLWSGSTFSISNLWFTPNLVIIKHHDQTTDQYAVFRTSIMPWNSTAYFGNALANFAWGITYHAMKLHCIFWECFSKLCLRNNLAQYWLI